MQGRNLKSVLNLSQTILFFLRVCSTILLKALCEKEKFLLFPLYFLPIRRIFLPFSSNLKLSSANSFSLEESEIRRLTTGQGTLTHYHTILHFDALKIYSCGKDCEKRRNCLTQAISPFSQCFLHYLAFVFQLKCT